MHTAQVNERIINESNPTLESRSCFRCGGRFQGADRERVCPTCKKPRGETPRLAPELSFRERQVVDLVAQGKANKEIAFVLLLTEGTIKEYLNRIFRKVAVSNRTELAIWRLSQRFAEEYGISRQSSEVPESAHLI